jgi:ribosomal protein L29
MIKDLDETNNTLNCILTNSGGTFGSGAIPLENVSGAIDKFQQETDARKKDINDLKKDIADLKGSLFVTRSDLLDIITKNHEQFTKEIDEIKKALISYMIITLFLTVGFIYCIINL